MHNQTDERYRADAIATLVNQSAKTIGFDAVGVAAYELLNKHSERFEKWIEQGYHADMDYLERSIPIRGDLHALLPQARSVVVTLTNYKRGREQPLSAPRIASFAWGEDYHPLIKNRLHTLLGQIKLQYPDVKGRVVVDSAPAFERAWAVKAGLGWIGRSSMLVNPLLGSFTLVGMLVLDCDVTASTPLEGELCGKCRRCVDSCPTGAITPMRSIDARRCLSYQTIERREEVDPLLSDQLQGRMFGCQSCLECCPYNHSAPVGELMPIDEQLIGMTREQWMDMEQAEFGKLFRGSCLERAGLEKLQSTLRADMAQ